MLNIALCEDQPSDIDNICALVEEYRVHNPQALLRVTTFSSADCFLKSVYEGAHYDICLLDVILPGMDGIAAAKALRKADLDIIIIFTTISKEFAVEAFSVKAANYLIKPVSRANLFSALDQAIATLGWRVERYTAIQTQKGDRMEKLSGILCVEVMGHSLCYHLADGSHVMSKVLRIPFEQAAADLFSNGNFIRPHRSFLVNTNSIQRLTKNAFVLENGMYVPISRLRYAEVKDQYMQYLTNMDGSSRRNGPADD